MKWSEILLQQDEDDRLSLPETRIVLSIFLPIRVQQEQASWVIMNDLYLLWPQELVETILYSMDRQKDGYIRLEDLVAGLRSSTSFSLSMYREEFILAGLMVAGFLLYQVQVFMFTFASSCFTSWPPRWQSSTVLCQLLVCTTALLEPELSIQAVGNAHNSFQTVPVGISNS